MSAARARELLATYDRVMAARLEGLGASRSSESLATLLELGRARKALGSPEARATLEAALAAAEEQGDQASSRAATIELGAWLVANGEEVGQDYLERAREAALQGGDARAARDAALAAAELAAARALLGDGAGGEAALGLARSGLAANPKLLARVELRSGDVASARGDSRAARAAYQRALDAAAAGAEDAVERAAIELAATERLESLATDAPSCELEALERKDVEALVEAGVRIARATGPSRADVALEVALALTGARGGRLSLGPVPLASAPSPEPPSFEVKRGDYSLRLAAGPAHALGRREELLARAVLAHVDVPEPQGAGLSRLLAMVDRVLGAGLELDRIVAVATDLAVEATGAARGLILLREPGARLAYRAARAAGRDIVDPTGVVSRSLVREAFLSGRALILGDAKADPELAKNASVGVRGLRSVLVAPISDSRGATLGLLYLDDPGTAGRFGAAERDLAVGFAARLGAPLRAVLERERERAATASARDALSRPHERPETRHPYSEIVGKSRKIGELLRLLDRAVETTATVLVLGESGTGKELVARAIHSHGARSAGPFVPLSCAALTDSLLESELFGHAAGAFTGAVRAHTGAFERASGGVLFLDELQDASPKLQADLLRVLETGEVRPLGGHEVRKVDVRVVAASNADLAALVTAGSFREDLYYRVNVFTIALPPLRERLDDIPDLVAHLLARAGQADRVLAPGVMERLLADPWSGNVRALKNCIDRALALAGPGPIRPEHVVLEAPLRREAPPLPERGSVYAGSVELNDRQLALIDRLRAEGEIRNADYAEHERVSNLTAWRDLSELVAKGVLVRVGRGKKTTYRLAPGWEARIFGS